MASPHSKVPAITLAFWAMKICATTLGETAGDLLSMTLGLGYVLSSLVLLSVFAATLFAQVRAQAFHPLLYWLVILSTSTAGTTLSDMLDRTLGLGYLTGAGLLAGLLAVVLVVWRRMLGSLSVSAICTRRAELFYWAAILCSNTLGTALGDFLADSSGLGFAGGALLISAVLLLIVIAHARRALSPTLLFWAAFVLTRPLGATLGDLLTKPLDHGGFALGTAGASLVLLGALLLLMWRSSRGATRA